MSLQFNILHVEDILNAILNFKGQAEVFSICLNKSFVFSFESHFYHVIICTRLYELRCILVPKALNSNFRSDRFIIRFLHMAELTR